MHEGVPCRPFRYRFTIRYYRITNDMKLKIIEKYKNRVGLYFKPPIHTGPHGNFIFVHINKTAGTSIVKIIGKPFRKHLTAKEIIDVIGQQKWDGAYKFAIVRNPWDKVVSQYKHNIKNNVTRMAEKRISFEDWVACTYGSHQGYYYDYRPQMFLPQVEWLRDFEGKIEIDEIVRFENLGEGMNRVFDRLGIQQELPHVNTTPKTIYQDFFTDESRRTISECFHEDIDLFGYTFGP